MNDFVEYNEKLELQTRNERKYKFNEIYNKIIKFVRIWKKNI